MKKLLLPLTCICLFVSSGMLAQHSDTADAKVKKIRVKETNRALIANDTHVHVNKITPRRSSISRRTDKFVTVKQGIALTGISHQEFAVTMSHRDMITAHKKIKKQY